MPTNADLQHLINELSIRVTSVEKLTAERADALEKRMKTYEEQLVQINVQMRDSSNALSRIETTVNGYKTSIKNFLDFLKQLLKWLFGIVTGILILTGASLIVAYITAHYIH